MGLFRLTGSRGGLTDEYVAPGDLVAGGENTTAGALTTVGAGTWLAAMIATGIIKRTGPVGGYTDTTDTAQAILNAIAGNAANSNVQPGTSFRFMFRNTVAQAMTWAAGRGVIAGDGTLDVAASLVREYLVTIMNASPEVLINCSTTNASAVVTFNLPAGAVSLPMKSGSNPQGYEITPGMSVSGTGITPGTTVLGVTQGIGGITGVTLSANATATNNPVSLTFSPTIKFDSLRAGTL